MRFNFIALQNMFLNLYLSMEVLLVKQPLFPAPPGFMLMQPHTLTSKSLPSASTVMRKQLQCLAHGHLCSSSWKSVIHSFSQRRLSSLFVDSKWHFLVQNLRPKSQGCSCLIIQLKNSCWIQSTAAWALVQRSTGCWGTMICAALLCSAAAGKTWVRLMRQDFTPDNTFSPSLSFFPVLISFFSVLCHSFPIAL